MVTFPRVRRSTISIALFCLAIATILSGCQTVSANISDGRYVSPLGNFSLPVPSGIGMKMSEDYDEAGGYVSFHDDFGSLSAISYVLLPADAIDVVRDPTSKDQAYAGFLHEYLMPGVFAPMVPTANVVYEEHLGEDQDRVFLAVVDLPGGSHLTAITRDGARSLDARRAILVFETHGTMYAVQKEIGGSLQQMGSDSGISPFSTDDDNLESVRTLLYRFMETIEFR